MHEDFQTPKFWYCVYLTAQRHEKLPHPKNKRVRNSGSSASLFNVVIANSIRCGLSFGTNACNSCTLYAYRHGFCVAPCVPRTRTLVVLWQCGLDFFELRKNESQTRSMFMDSHCDLETTRTHSPWISGAIGNTRMRWQGFPVLCLEISLHLCIGFCFDEPSDALHSLFWEPHFHRTEPATSVET